MPWVRHSVGGRRSFEENERGPAFSELERPIVDPFSLPESEDFFFETGKRYVGANSLEHAWARLTLGVIKFGDYSLRLLIVGYDFVQRSIRIDIFVEIVVAIFL